LTKARSTLLKNLSCVTLSSSISPRIKEDLTLGLLLRASKLLVTHYALKLHCEVAILILQTMQCPLLKQNLAMVINLTKQRVWRHQHEASQLLIRNRKIYQLYKKTKQVHKSHKWWRTWIKVLLQKRRSKTSMMLFKIFCLHGAQ
jgi:hypothetical protein